MDKSRERGDVGGDIRRSKRSTTNTKRKSTDNCDLPEFKRKKSNNVLVSSTDNPNSAKNVSTSPVSHRTRSCTSLSTLGASLSRSSSLPGSLQPNRRVPNSRSDSNVASPTNASRSTKRTRTSVVSGSIGESAEPSSDRSASSSATSLNNRARRSSSSISKPSSANSLSETKGENGTAELTPSSHVKRKSASRSNSSIDTAAAVESAASTADQLSSSQRRLRLRLRKQTVESESLPQSKSKLNKKSEKRSFVFGSGSASSQSKHKKKGSESIEPSVLSGPGGLRQSLRKKKATGSCASNNVAPEQPSTSGQSRTVDSPQLANASEDNEEAQLDDDLTRLQALLEARGLPPHLFGALGPRMHQLLHRSMSGGITGKVQQLLTDIQSSDECQQLQAVMELCQILVMGNEDTLGGFPIKQAVPVLINLLSMEHNFEMMNHACRALTYLMEALPRSSVVVVEAVPMFLQKLQSIQCMDVAEQALTALEMLSRRHGKSILQAEGMNACLTYLDFFSITAQRAALAIAANCCHFVTNDDFHFVIDAIPILSAKLQIQDKKSIQSCCLAFTRLVDNLHSDEKLLRELANHGLLANIQQLLVVSPPVVSTSTFVAVLRMLAIMCGNCPYIAVELLKNNIAETLRFLLMGASEVDELEMSELSPRTPQEFYEITCLISELLPDLPSDGIFSFDSLLNKRQRPEQVLWQWKDDQGVWHSYTWIDSRIIEAAHQSGEDELSINTLGRSYIVDFNTMLQINEDTGTSRSIQRCSGASAAAAESVTSDVKKEDERASFLQEGSDISSQFTLALFGELNEVHNSSVGAVVRHKCLNAILRMLYYSPPELLSKVIAKFPVSSQMAGMLASNDLRTVVNALQMAEILMQKLPDYFHVHFRREGVMHKIHDLANSKAEITRDKDASDATDVASTCMVTSENSSKAEDHCDVQTDDDPLDLLVSPSRKFSDVLKRKRRSKRISYKKSSSLDNTSRMTDKQKPSKSSSFSSVPSSVLTSLRCDTDALSNKTIKTPISSDIVENKTKIKEWITQQAIKFTSTYFENKESETHPALKVLRKLSDAADNLGTTYVADHEALKKIAQVLTEDERSASAFEILHSGLVPKLLSYLAPNSPGKDQSSHETRTKTFLHAFLGYPGLDDIGEFTRLDDKCRIVLNTLVQKLHACVNQQEQFPVKIHDAPGGCGNGSRGLQTLRFFNSHQIKCFLQRKPGCTNVKNWRGGPVKIDPLALVQAIERYLVLRGYGRVQEDADDDGSDEDISEEDIEEALASQNLGSQNQKHYLDIMIGDKVLPYNMTVYQAIKQYGQVDEEKDNEEEGVLGRPSIWVGTHSIHYRASTKTPEKDEPSTSKASSSNQAHLSKNTKKLPLKRNKETTTDNNNGLSLHNTNTQQGLKDSSMEGIFLLRTLFNLNFNWGTFYGLENCGPLIPANEFVNTKLTAKAIRQLQDPIAIMTGNFPPWLGILAHECLFLFPFECRQQFFYCSTFDRDRAMSKLQETIPDLLSAEASDRVTPRLERKKRTVSRDNIFKQGEEIINEVGSSRAILEIQYQDEVGTGLGPTLEFYALVSKEFQRADLAMWRGDSVPASEEDDMFKEISYVFSSVGLYPAPIAKNTKAGIVLKLKAKFRFLGKFIAKAIMDFRMLDIPLSQAFFKWLLNRQDALDYRDLWFIDPVIAKSISQLQDIVRKRKRLEADSMHTPESLQLAIESLTLDGLPIDDLDLDFRLPGTTIELKKGGKDIPVTIHNLEEYIKLVVQWTLVDGVSKQMQAFKEGFESVFPLSSLNCFSPKEMDLLLCGSSVEIWDMKSLMESCRPDHGYTHDSRAVKFLFEILSSYTKVEQRRFLQFVTGSPKLPVGGFKRLTPPLKIVRKTLEGPLSPDDYLPSVMTCMNYLKLPDYSNKEIMKEKLRTAALEGQHSFHLS